MTTWNQFVDQIEREAQEQGQEALDELEAFKQHFSRQRTKCEEEGAQQPCLLEGFFKHQKTLPPSMRSAGAMISCPCPRCNPARL